MIRKHFSWALLTWMLCLSATAQQLGTWHMYLSYYIATKSEASSNIIYSLMNGTFTKEANAFKNITDEFLVRNDEYFVFADFDAYVKAHEKTYEIMQQPALYAKMALINIAKSAYFSSDRTIEDYVRDIWHLKKL